MGLKSGQFSHPFILRPRPGVGRRIPGLTSERRWQWTRKLGWYCFPPRPWASARVFACRTRRGEDHIFILETKKCSRGRRS